MQLIAVWKKQNRDMILMVVRGAYLCAVTMSHLLPVPPQAHRVQSMQQFGINEAKNLT